MDNYRFILDAYYGTGGFAAGGYLLRNIRETDKNYEKRKDSSYYLNYFAPIINALVDPIFKKQALRNWDGGERPELQTFLNDVDCAGTAMQDFIKEAALKAKLLGAVFVVVDNFTEVPANMADALANRALPYAYIVSPQNVESYVLDKAGKLLSITFNDIIEDGNRTNRKQRKITYTATTWRITDQDGSIASAGTHNLGEIPVVYFPSRTSAERTIKPPPEFLAIARTARSLYNKCSLLDQVLINQTFSILTLPSLKPKELELSATNALSYDGEISKHAPAFIAPDASCAATLIEECDKLIQEMYRMAGLAFMTGTRQEQSGTSKQWDFERTNQSLADFAAMIQRVEQQVVHLFCKWQGLDDKGYTVDYPDDYGIVDVQGEIDKAQAVLDLNLCPGIKVDVLKKVLGAVFPDMTTDRFDELVSEAEAEDTDSKQGLYNALSNGLAGAAGNGAE